MKNDVLQAEESRILKELTRRKKGKGREEKGELLFLILDFSAVFRSFNSADDL